MILFPRPIPFRRSRYAATTGHEASLTTFGGSLRYRFGYIWAYPAGNDGAAGSVAAVGEGSEGAGLEEEDDDHEGDADEDHG